MFLLFLDHFPKRYITIVVVDTPASTAEDICIAGLKDFPKRYWSDSIR